MTTKHLTYENTLMQIDKHCLMLSLYSFHLSKESKARPLLVFLFLEAVNLMCFLRISELLESLRFRSAGVGLYAVATCCKWEIQEIPDRNILEHWIIFEERTHKIHLV